MSINLGEVLFPLRFDVWDQAPVIEEMSRLYGNTLAMLEAGHDTAIHRHVVIADPVYQEIGLLAPCSDAELEHRIERYYGARMEKLVSYYNSIKKGWDKDQEKIYFKRVENPTVTTAGFPVPDGLFLTNGQHRTAVLLALNYTELPDHIAAVVTRDGADFIPLDLTWPCIQAGACTERDFVKFARLRFDLPARVSKIAGLRQWARQTDAPAWLLEYLDLYWGPAS